MTFQTVNKDFHLVELCSFFRGHTSDLSSLTHAVDERAGFVHSGGLGEGLTDGDGLGDFEGEREGERDVDGERDVEGDKLGDTDGESETDGEPDGEREGDKEVEGDADGLGDGDRDAEADKDGDGDGERLGEIDDTTAWSSTIIKIPDSSAVPPLTEPVPVAVEAPRIPYAAKTSFVSHSSDHEGLLVAIW